MDEREARSAVMGAISMALKDPILRQGFKCICKENAELKGRDCWKSCEYTNPKSALIEQHIKDVQNLARAKEIIKEFVDNVERYSINNEILDRAEQFLSEVEK